MQRAQKMKTTEGMTAWLAYSTWMKFQGRKVPPQTTFLESRYYQSLVKFAAFMHSIPTIDMDSYIRLMIKLNMQPAIWAHPDVYKMYIKSTKRESPIKQVQEATLFIMEFCDKEGYSISEFFQSITCPQLVQWIRDNDVTPWLLLVSTKFKQWYAALDEDDQDAINAIIDIDNWAQKIRNSPEVVKQTKGILAELGL
jgi:hypothetical protein